MRMSVLGQLSSLPIVCSVQAPSPGDGSTHAQLNFSVSYHRDMFKDKF